MTFCVTKITPPHTLPRRQTSRPKAGPHVQPLRRVFRAFGPIERPRHNSQVIQITGKGPFPRPRPRPAAGVMRDLERLGVIYLHIAGIGEHVPAISPNPFACCHNAGPAPAKGHRDAALGNQQLRPQVLTVAILIRPAAPFAPVIEGESRLPVRGQLKRGGRGLLRCFSWLTAPTLCR